MAFTSHYNVDEFLSMSGLFAIFYLKKKSNLQKKELYSKHPYTTYHLASVVNILLYSLCHIFIHSSIHLIFDGFQSKLQLVVSSPDTSVFI